MRRGLLILTLLAACSDEVVSLLDAQVAGIADSGAPRTDTGAPDLGVADTPLADAPAADAVAPIDAGFADASAPDASAPDASTPADAEAPRDTGIAAECLVATDCGRLRAPPSVRWCQSSSWSCIEGRCAWECSRSGRTCERDAAGCMRCAGDPTSSCPGDACNFRIPMTRPMIEEATCARAFLAGQWRCFGDWIELDDPMTCSLESLPTGALRSVLTCQRCQTTYYF